MKYTVRYTREGAREHEVAFRDGNIYRAFFDSMEPVGSEFEETIQKIMKDYGIEPTGDSPFAKKAKWEKFNDYMWEGKMLWNFESVSSLATFFFLLEEGRTRVNVAPPVLPHQREEEDFIYVEEYTFLRDGLEIYQRLKYLDGIKVYTNFYKRDIENEKTFHSPLYGHYKHSMSMFYGLFARLYVSEGKKSEAIKNAICPIISIDYSSPERKIFPILFRDFMEVESSIRNAK